MRLLGVLVGAVAAFAAATALVGFTSAVQIQKTLALMVILAVIFCPLLAWIFNKYGKEQRPSRHDDP